MSTPKKIYPFNFTSGIYSANIPDDLRNDGNTNVPVHECVIIRDRFDSPTSGVLANQLVDTLRGMKVDVYLVDYNQDGKSGHKVVVPKTQAGVDVQAAIDAAKETFAVLSSKREFSRSASAVGMAQGNRGVQLTR